MAKIQARVLAPFFDAGRQINPNDLVEGEAGLIKAMKETGTVDADKAAVAYCKEQGAEAIGITGDGMDFAAAEHASDMEKATKKQVDGDNDASQPASQPA